MIEALALLLGFPFALAISHWHQRRVAARGGFWN